MTSPTERLLTTQEVAGQLSEKTKRKLSSADVAAMCQRDEFTGAHQSAVVKGVQDVASWRIPQAAVDDWLARNGFVQAPFYQKTWLIVSGVVLFLAALFGSFADSLDVFGRLWPPPSPTATPTPFAPATGGATMIVIFPFHNTSEINTEPHKKIWRKIQEILEQMPDKSVTVVIDPNVIPTADERLEVERAGRLHNASMVIWGEDTGVELIARFLNLREPSFDARDVNIRETERTQLANPSRYAEFVTRDLPGQIAFLALFAVGQSYYLNGDYPAAIDTIESAVAEVRLPDGGSANDQAPDITQGLVEAYLLLGWLYQQPPVDLDAAIDDLSKAIELDPQDAVTYNNRGSAYYDQGELDQAITDLSKAIELDPELAIAYKNRGFAYGNKGELDQAIADYSKAIELDPRDVIVYNNRGFAYGNKGELDQAIADYNKAIELDPQYAIAYINRGLAYRDKGELDQAIADLSKAIELDPQDAVGYAHRGYAYSVQDDLEQAIADYSKAIELDPQLAIAYYNRGRAYYDQGELDQAIADYSKAIELYQQDAIGYYKRGSA
jgi:tetratricopeptide (TPR) repeat protein